MSQAAAELDQDQIAVLSDRASARVLNRAGTTEGNKAGWLMMTTILIEAWDLYALAFVLVFIRKDFHPSAFQLGLITGVAHLGGLLGALAGGWLCDRLGRRIMFLATMIMFIIFALAQAFAPNMWVLIALRFCLGFPLGTDMSTGFSYVMEAMPKGKREVMANRWQLMFAIGQVVSIGVVTIMYLTGMDHTLLWRIALAIGALPAAALLIGRLDLPDTVLSLIQRGKFVEAKKVSQRMFGDDLEMLPDHDVEVIRPRTADFVNDMFADPVRKRATIFSWMANLAQSLQSGAFSFYLPTIVLIFGVSSSTAASNFILLIIYALAGIGALTAPMVLAKLGHRGVSRIGFFCCGTFLILCGLAMGLNLKWLLPIFAIGAQGFHYWAGSNVVTVGSMVASPRYRATATGFSYMFTKLGNFVALLFFPTLIAWLGTSWATACIALASLFGFIGAQFVLKEVYGYAEQDTAAEVAA